MANVLRNQFICVMRKIVHTPVKRTVIPIWKVSTPASTATRGLARNYWCLTSTCKITEPMSVSATKIANPSGCCSLHTDGDKEFLKFLDNEIDFEVKSNKENKQTPKLKDWKLSTDGSDVKLTRTASGEIVTVKFNVNNSVNPEEEEYEPGKEPKEEESTKMISKPSFSVEIQKANGNILRFMCSFLEEYETEEVEAEQESERDLEDQFGIDEVCIYKEPLKDTVYTISAAVMDGVMYDKLMDMLDERGVTDEFITEITKFSTDYEHGRYINFLKDLKGFLQDK
ncbi:hypothetical protein CHS0354_013212 [Potamilus streckersoni]|uniref:Complement component 1 Q subcomponent-binding protein, mitochondrial n=1 Tax=Potamilus streckersoni TaxID=2493646 RepID=A0AAE0SR52_9BIVA|nr:hypothetical protein CHS0354_013212 [Potamilus streckersoni]